MKLIGANPILRVYQEPYGGKPFVEADWRILENRPDLQRELLLRVILVAAIDLRLRQPGQLGSATGGALDRTIGPANLNHELAAVLSLGKPLNCLL